MVNRNPATAFTRTPESLGQYDEHHIRTYGYRAEAQQEVPAAAVSFPTDKTAYVSGRMAQSRNLYMIFRRSMGSWGMDGVVSGKKVPEVSFPAALREAILDGTKLVSSRPLPFGEVGDHFTVFGHEFVLLEVKELSLSLVAAYLYRVEGYTSELEFVESWLRLYPEIGYHPDQTVYVHMFAKVTG